MKKTALSSIWRRSEIMEGGEWEAPTLTEEEVNVIAEEKEEEEETLEEETLEEEEDARASHENPQDVVHNFFYTNIVQNGQQDSETLRARYDYGRTTKISSDEIDPKISNNINKPKFCKKISRRRRQKVEVLNFL